MRTLLIAAVLVFAATPINAQGPNFGAAPKEDKEMKAKRQAEQDQAYKSTIQRIPAKEAPVDPWSGARGSSPAETSPPAQGRPKKP